MVVAQTICEMPKEDITAQHGTTIAQLMEKNGFYQEQIQHSTKRADIKQQSSVQI